MPKIDPQVFHERLATYRKALQKFATALAMPHDRDKAYLDVSAHRFIYCYELTWKQLRRLLRMREVKANSPVMTFRHAYAEGWIDDKNIYQSMIEDRNTVTHEYFEEKAAEVYSRLPGYLQEMQALANRIQTIYEQEPDTL